MASRNPSFLLDHTCMNTRRLLDEQIISNQKSEVNSSLDGSRPLQTCGEMISNRRNCIRGPIQKYLDGL
eukprot:12422866-Karenia_brevis.AAC.1